MKKIQGFLILLLIILLLGGMTVFSLMSEKVAQNPSGTVGNTAGNLINNGLFCEAEGKVYFSNPYDENTLYVMNTDESEAKKLTTVGVNSINAAGNYVYYYQNSTGSGSGLGYAVKTTGMYRVTKDGDKYLCLKRDPVGTLTLIDNTIYYQHHDDAIQGFRLDSISTDKKQESVIFDSIISPACAVNGVIYYNNPLENNYLYSYDTHTGANTLVWQHKVYNPIYHTDGYLYFMDVETEYELHRYDLTSGSHEVITTDRVESYNIAGDYIYYQKFSQNEPALMRVYTNGTGSEVVAYGNYENINVTSNYVYFSEYQTPSPLYHQAVFGPVNVTVFKP